MEYSVKYFIEKGKFTKEELEEQGFGGCDAFLLASILREENGGLKVGWGSVDGQQPEAKKIPDRELFHIIVMMMLKIEKSVELEEWQRLLLQSHCRAVKDVITGRPRFHRTIEPPH